MEKLKKVILIGNRIFQSNKNFIFFKFPVFIILFIDLVLFIYVFVFSYMDSLFYSESNNEFPLTDFVEESIKFFIHPESFKTTVTIILELFLLFFFVGFFVLLFKKFKLKSFVFLAIWFLTFFSYFITITLFYQ